MFGDPTIDTVAVKAMTASQRAALGAVGVLFKANRAAARVHVGRVRRRAIRGLDARVRIEPAEPRLRAGT